MRKLIILPLMLCAWSSSGRRIARNIVCRNGTGYVQNGICCLNCPAGTFVKVACKQEFTMGVCQHCEFDTYTEYDNGISPSCLKCTKCHPDQETVEQCNSTRNTRCQCKAGTYCRPDQACEICRTCRKCEEDEEMVTSCTAVSNTVCEKRTSGSNNTSTGNAAAAAGLSVMAIFIIFVILACILFSRKSENCKKTVASRWLRGIRKTCLESDNDLEEVNQNTVNDQLLHCSNQPKNEDPAQVVPINEDDSLRKSFDLFAEIDVNFHNRFFRSIGLSDNTIRTADLSCASPEDKVYKLLKIWMEKEGMKADFNSLIKALINLNQRLSAENITAKAIEYGYFRYKD